jgi:hypothetical protein
MTLIDMHNPTHVLAYLLQIKDKVQGLQKDLEDTTLKGELRQKKKDWVATYNNLADSLEVKYFELTNRLN